MRERTDFMVLSLGDGAAGNDEEILAGGFWNRAGGGVMLCRFRVYTVCPSVTTAHLQIGSVTFYPAFSPYSRFLNWPGCGFGYRPLASGIKGDGPSAVSLSVLGEYSWSWLRASSKEISWPVWALRRPILQTTLASTPRLTSLWGLSLRMASRRAIHSFL